MHETDLDLVMDGVLRTVTAQRAQELKKAGVKVWWSTELGCYVYSSDVPTDYSYFAKRGIAE